MHLIDSGSASVRRKFYLLDEERERGRVTTGNCIKSRRIFFIHWPPQPQVLYLNFRSIIVYMSLKFGNSTKVTSSPVEEGRWI